MKTRTLTHEKVCDDSLSVFDSFYQENKGKVRTRGRPKKPREEEMVEVKSEMVESVGHVEEPTEADEPVQDRQQLENVVTLQVPEKEESGSDDVTNGGDISDAVENAEIDASVADNEEQDDTQTTPPPPKVAVKSKPNPDMHAITTRKRYNASLQCPFLVDSLLPLF